MKISEIPEREATKMFLAITDSPIRNSIFNILYSKKCPTSNYELVKKMGNV